MANLNAARCLAVGLVLATPSAAQDEGQHRILAGGGPITVEVPARSNWCQSELTVRIRAQEDTLFDEDVATRRRVTGVIGAALSRECPNARTVTINGFVDDVFLYRAVGSWSASRAWVVVEMPVDVVVNPPSPPLPTPQQARQPREPSAASVADCDRDAAHPDDPTKLAGVAGVQDDDMHAGRALEVCEDAILFDPDNPRIMYQLARAYLMYDLAAEGVELMAEAAEEGHPVAIAVLGDIALYGLLGDEPDPALARSLYLRAAEAGFRPALALAESIQDNPTEDASQSVSAEPTFHEPERMEALVESKAIPGTGLEFYRNFVYVAYSIGGIRIHCPAAGLSRQVVTVDVIIRVLNSKIPEVRPHEIEAAINLFSDSAWHQQARDDGFALAVATGCQSAEVTNVHKLALSYLR